jgi:hypothetical protein
LDDKSKPVKSYYVGDPEAVKKANGSGRKPGKKRNKFKIKICKRHLSAQRQVSFIF